MFNVTEKYNDSWFSCQILYCFWVNKNIITNISHEVHVSAGWKKRFSLNIAHFISEKCHNFINDTTIKEKGDILYERQYNSACSEQEYIIVI